MKRFLKLLVIVLCVSMLTPSTVPYFGVECVEAAQKIKLNYTKRTIYEGDSFTLKLKGTKKKVTWSSSNKKVATVSSKGVVKGKSGGSSKKTCKITAKAGEKKYVCKVTVKVLPEEEEDEDTEEEEEDSDTDSASTGNIAKNIAEVKNYIQKNGYTNVNGDKVIRGKEDLYTPAIVYEKKRDTLVFLMDGKDDLEILVDMEIGSSDNSAPIEVSFICGYSIYIGAATTTIIPSEYINDKNYKFTFEYNSMPIDESESGELANNAVRLAFLQWDYLLRADTGYGLKDIGFTAMD